MKHISTLVFALLFFGNNIAISQNELMPQGGARSIPQNEGHCLSQEDRIDIQEMLATNIQQLRTEGRLLADYTRGSHPLFSWPISQVEGFDYNSVWVLTNYLDHNTNFPNQIEDYNCGTKSYDTDNGYNHQGYDIITWPFWWKQMDDNQAQNIAAADGQIIGKMDGAFDRNCSFNPDPWNAVFVQHNDGSVTWYGHMKEGTLTTKDVGDSVSRGEFLGIVGSSGSSTVPHIHFEVYDNGGNLIDPNIGNCNDLNTDTWWEDQKPYTHPTLNAALTHFAPPEFLECPATAITNESNEFELGDTVYFAIYMKDQEPGSSIQHTITRPDGSVFQNFSFVFADYFNISFWYWPFEMDMEGLWTWETSYMGDIVTRQFGVGILGNQDNALAQFRAYPNPTQDEVTIQLGSSHTEISLTITNMLGQIVHQEHFSNTEKISFEIEGNTGIYFATVKTNNGKKETLKIMKQ